MPEDARRSSGAQSRFLMGDMELSIRVISDVRRLADIEDEWNAFVGTWSKNPFLLTGFVKQYMEYWQSRGWTALVLIVSAGNAMQAVAPLILKRQFGLLFARPLLPAWTSPDFVTCGTYREECVTAMLGYLLDKVGCGIVDLTMPASSQHLRIVKQKCKLKRMAYRQEDRLGHCILDVKSTWPEFVKSRGRQFRRDIARTEKRLGAVGQWKTVCKGVDEAREVFEMIMSVEKNSWKEKWRAETGKQTDADLLMIWGGLQHRKANPRWRIWFLDVNSEIVAYALIIEHGGVAYMTKTSYNIQYERCSPGIYLTTVAIHDLFERQEVGMIDFLTAIPFMRTWTSTSERRIRVLVAGRGVLPRIVLATLASAQMKRVRDLIQDIGLFRKTRPVPSPSIA